MSQKWDGNKGGRDQWIKWLAGILTECHRILKPGAHGLVWALPRTSHWTGSAIETAGFEVRDVITHLFGTGFPKSHDIAKAIDREAGADPNIVEAMLNERERARGRYGAMDGNNPVTIPATARL